MLSNLDWTAVTTALISSAALITVALIPKREVKRLREENTDQHNLNSDLAEKNREILERFEKEADYDRKSILKAVNAVEKKVEKVDDRVERIDGRLGKHIEWHLDQE